MLVLLNGPPASGKSTIAERLVAERPLALRLDVDVVRSLLGDWLDRPTDAGLAARTLALAMARTHLAAGHDVVVPQFLSRVEFIEQLEQLADDVGATFIEVALTLERDTALAAFDERRSTSTDAAHRDSARLIDRWGGSEALGEMLDRYAALLDTRPHASRVVAVRGDVEQTVERVEAVVRDASQRRSEITIRPEVPADSDAIAGVVERAFGSPVEAGLVEAIRASNEYLPELSMVALTAETDPANDRIVGHVMISRCRIETPGRPIDAVMLSPLAVEPRFHGEGIGSALVRNVTARAGELGHPFVVLEGDPRYYARFGFVPASTYGLQMPLPDWAPVEAAQLLVLDDDVTPPSGRVVYPDSFDGLEDTDR